MISVILTILKILGFVILGIIGLALLLAFAILFVPVRYRIGASIKDSDYFGKAKFHWLLHIVSLECDFKAGAFDYILRVFGIGVKTSNKYKKTKSSYREEKSNAKEVISPDEVTSDASTTKVDDSSRIVEKKETKHKKSSKKKKDKKADLKNDNRKSIGERFKGFFKGLISFKENIRDKYERFRNEIDNPKTKEAYELVKLSVIKLAKHYKPRSLRGHIEIGFDNPADTGMLIGFYYAIFPVQKKFSVTANFNEKVIEGDIALHGKVRLNHLVIPVIKIFKNEKIKQYLNKED